MQGYSNQFLYSCKHFSNHLECKDIQIIVINFPITKTLVQQFSNYHIQQKLSLKLQSWNNIKIFSHKHINKPTHLMHNSSQIHKHIQCCQQPKRVNKNLQIQALDSEIPLKLAKLARTKSKYGRKNSHLISKSELVLRKNATSPPSILPNLPDLEEGMKRVRDKYLLRRKWGNQV